MQTRYSFRATFMTAQGIRRVVIKAVHVYQARIIAKSLAKSNTWKQLGDVGKL